VEGIILGCAVGESLALARVGLHPRKAIKIYGRSPLTFQFQPGRGVSGERTHGLLMTIQAMLESRSDHRSFGRKLRKRVSWYRLGFPIRSTLRAISSAKNFSEGDSFQLANDPLVRAAAISVVIQGSQHGQPWVEEALDATMRSSAAFEPAMLIAHATQLAQMTEPNEFDSQEVLNKLSQTTDDPEVQQLLSSLKEHLACNRSVVNTARCLGWETGIPSRQLPIAIMAIYAWLRHPNRFRLAVERSALLGGECCAVAAVAGVLSGATLGKRGIPPDWLKKTTLYPHDKNWREQLIGRVKDWPHGVEDIQDAHAEPSRVFGQILRNTLYSLFRTIHVGFRFPLLFVPNPPKRKSKPTPKRKTNPSVAKPATTSERSNAAGTKSANGTVKASSPKDSSKRRKRK
jgi:ADP-ribosyl-[dinitrogen reductase] hydrolase